MESEKAFERQEAADIKWQNEQAAGLAQKAAEKFLEGSTDEASALLVQTREAARVIHKIHDLYEITRIGRARLGLPEFAPEVEEFQEPSEKPVQEPATQPAEKSELQQTWDAMDQHLGTSTPTAEPAEPETPEVTETTKELVAEKETVADLSFEGLPPSAQKTLEALRNLSDKGAEGIGFSKKQIGERADQSEGAVAQNIYRAKDFTNKKDQGFKIVDVKQDLQPGQKTPSIYYRFERTGEKVESAPTAPEEPAKAEETEEKLIVLGKEITQVGRIRDSIIKLAEGTREKPITITEFAEFYFAGEIKSGSLTLNQAKANVGSRLGNVRAVLEKYRIEVINPVPRNEGEAAYYIRLKGVPETPRAVEPPSAPSEPEPETHKSPNELPTSVELKLGAKETEVYAVLRGAVTRGKTLTTTELAKGVHPGLEINEAKKQVSPYITFLRNKLAVKGFTIPKGLKDEVSNEAIYTIVSLNPITEAATSTPELNAPPIQEVENVEGQLQALAGDDDWVAKLREIGSRPLQVDNGPEGIRTRLILTPAEKYRLGERLLTLNPAQLTNAGLTLPTADRKLISDILDKLKAAQSDIVRASQRVAETLKRKLEDDKDDLYAANEADEDTLMLLIYAGIEKEIRANIVLGAANR